MITTTARKSLAAFTIGLSVLAVLPGCAVTRGQEKVGAYIDDTSITTAGRPRCWPTSPWTAPRSGSRP